MDRYDPDLPADFVHAFVRGGLDVHCREGYQDLSLHDLPWDDLTAIAAHGELVKHSAHHRILRVPAPDDSGRHLFIKRYHFTELDRLMRSFNRPSRAYAECQVYLDFERAGVGVPRVVLIAERRNWLFTTESFLVTEEITGARDVKRIHAELTGRERRDFIGRVGEVLGRLHERGLWIDDMKGDHLWLADTGYAPEDMHGVTLLDMLGSRVGPPASRRIRAKNLAQLSRSLNLVDRSDQARLLRGALGGGANRRDARHRIWRRYLRFLTVMVPAVAERWGKKEKSS